MQVRTGDYSVANNAVAGYLTGVLVGGTTASGCTSPATAGTFVRDNAASPNTAGTRQWGSPFSQGCLFAMCDATVRMFPYSLLAPGTMGAGINATNLGTLVTPTGGEVVTLPDT